MTITNYKPINKKTLIGVFDLTLPSGLCIYGAMCHRKDDVGFITFPGKPYTGKSGDTLYAKIVDIPDRDRRDKFNEQVIAALKERGHV